MGSFNPDSEPVRSALKNYIVPSYYCSRRREYFFIAKRKSQKGESAESSVFLLSFFATKPHPNAEELLAGGKKVMTPFASSC